MASFSFMITFTVATSTFKKKCFQDKSLFLQISTNYIGTKYLYHFSTGEVGPAKEESRKAVGPNDIVVHV